MNFGGPSCHHWIRLVAQCRLNRFSAPYVNSEAWFQFGGGILFIGCMFDAFSELFGRFRELFGPPAALKAVQKNGVEASNVQI